MLWFVVKFSYAGFSAAELVMAARCADEEHSDVFEVAESTFPFVSKSVLVETDFDSAELNASTGRDTFQHLRLLIYFDISRFIRQYVNALIVWWRKEGLWSHHM